MSTDKKIPLRVLILEDRAEDAELILRTLHKARFNVDARCVQDEAGFKANLDEAMDVILADYALPGYDALRALRYLQDKGWDIPFIIVTGALSDEEAVACLQHGANDYVRKDRLARLGHAVTSAIKQKRLRTEQRGSELALRVSEQRFHLLFNKIHDAVFVVEILKSGKHSQFIEVNEAACQRLGYTREELFRLKLQTITVPERVRMIALIEKRVSTEKTFSFDTELTARKGLRIPVEMNVHLIELNGKPAMLAIARDVSELRKLERLIYEIDEMEKQFLGQELHDSIGQYLTAITFKSKVLENRLKALNIIEAAEAEALTQLINQTSVHARNISKTLFPVELEKKGLETALQNLLAFMETQFKASCKLDYQLPAGPINILMAIHLFRIIQETMNNAVKHNHARKFKIRLACEQERIVLNIWHDGLPPSAGSDKQPGIGRTIMDYRRKMLNATMQYQKFPNGGHEMILSFPQNIVVIA